ncbi:efflux transporter, outer membrane factor (OMF) lipoprotein, NodT family [Noviherbaspirillum humi]|uniref:Efflux transporter, outer membrane factor (OMF) lipoprotein, NodT family n=1 Tax=Noviherbaspirillum humi TaxID=1688639 RepID=A0A239D7W5_9BURK|nr:efflux transporter outer membrane subunit [Noviherbaspirillum humi]SNS28596.1 efflux transporter, outer membrane factor (OMF) lipoprotein, NodT family [Noviherbaspirillum humi]
MKAKRFFLAPPCPVPAALAIALAVALAGCAGLPDMPSQPKALSAADLALAVPAADGDRSWPSDGWWRAYGDPQLDALMQKALDASPSLASARARIARAQAAVAGAQSAIGIQLNGSADVSYGRQSENYILPKPPLGKGGESISQGLAAVDFSYDLDFWGRNGTLVQAAQAQLKAAGYDQDAARLALSTSVARAYGQLAAQYDMLEVLQQTLQQRRAMRELVAKRVANGLDTKVELKQSESGEAALGVDIAQLQGQIEVTRLQIAALCGDLPGAAAAIRRPRLALAAFNLPPDISLDLLGRRPEVSAQRERLTAAFGELDAARAQFYPNLSLNGLAGVQAIGLPNLLSPGSLITSVGPALRLPLFDQGRLKANHAGRAADIDLAVSQYNASILSAAQDAAEQLARIASLAREEKAAAEALAAAEEAYRLAMLRYQGGLSPFLTVLSAETGVLAQRRVAAEIRARRQDLHVTLVRALGGGFTDAQPAPLARAGR